MTYRIAAAGALLVLSAAQVQAQSTPLQQPFAIGEALTYRVRIGGMISGSGELRVEGPEAIRGRETYVLHFDVRGGFGPVRVEGRTRSWLDPDGMTALRYYREEKSPLGRSRESVEMHHGDGEWRSPDGKTGTMPTRMPLDELSFLFYVRTLPLKDGATYGVERHFDSARNPVTITVHGRERIEVPAGEFNVVVVDMQVPEGENTPSDGLIRLYLTDDAWRIPVRIESSVRVLGRVVFSLESGNRHPALATGTATGSR